MKNSRKAYYKVGLRKNESDDKYIQRVYKKYKKYIDEGHQRYIQEHPTSKMAKHTALYDLKNTLKLVQREKPNKDFQLQVSMAVNSVASEELEDDRKAKVMKKEWREQLKEEGITPRKRNVKGQFISSYNPDAEYWSFEDESGKTYNVTRRKYPDKHGNWYEIIEE